MSAANKDADAKTKIPFEKALARLEEVVQRLESANLTLDDAMKLFEEGVQLARECQRQLSEAEGRVEKLIKKADGSIGAVALELPDDDETES